jgi:hypothetical protein
VKRGLFLEMTAVAQDSDEEVLGADVGVDDTRDEQTEQTDTIGDLLDGRPGRLGRMSATVHWTHTTNIRVHRSAIALLGLIMVETERRIHSLREMARRRTGRTSGRRRGRRRGNKP